MRVATVDLVESKKGASGKTLIFVHIEGKKYIVFDKKWLDTQGCVVKYESTQNGQYTNLELLEIIGKSGTQEELKTGGFVKEANFKEDDTFVKETNDVTMKDAFIHSERAALAFVKAGYIKDMDEYIAFLGLAINSMKSFLEYEVMQKKD
jgi:hypothetical protein